jgi:hypothetical protein
VPKEDVTDTWGTDVAKGRARELIREMMRYVTLWVNVMI